MTDSIFEVIDKISRATRFEEGNDVLRRAIIEMGLSHVAYAALNLPSIKRVRPLVAITYAAEWQKHYEQEGYVNVDPVVRAGWREMNPTLARGVMLSRRGALLARLGVVRVALGLLMSGSRAIPKLVGRVSAGNGAGVMKGTLLHVEDKGAQPRR